MTILLTILTVLLIACAIEVRMGGAVAYVLNLSILAAAIVALVAVLTFVVTGINPRLLTAYAFGSVTYAAAFLLLLAISRWRLRVNGEDPDKVWKASTRYSTWLAGIVIWPVLLPVVISSLGLWPRKKKPELPPPRRPRDKP